MPQVQTSQLGSWRNMRSSNTSQQGSCALMDINVKQTSRCNLYPKGVSPVDGFETYLFPTTLIFLLGLVNLRNKLTADGHQGNEAINRMETRTLDTAENQCREDPFKAEEGAPQGAGRWSVQEDDALRNAALQYGESEKDWKAIAALVGSRTAAQCHDRWSLSVNTNIRHVERPDSCAWSQAEDDQLLRAHVQGKTWVEIADVLGGRTRKQCRRRFVDVLDPYTNRHPWTEAEDQALLEAHAVHGNNWVRIQQALPAQLVQARVPVLDEQGTVQFEVKTVEARRTTTALRNRWNARSRSNNKKKQPCKSSSTEGEQPGGSSCPAQPVI